MCILIKIGKPLLVFSSEPAKSDICQFIFQLIGNH